MPKINEATAITSIQMAEQASAPATPASGQMKVYAKSDGYLYYKNDAGTETQLGAATAADVLYEITPGGRLTLTSGTPITTSDVTGAGTLYYTPYLHNVIHLYCGSAWVRHTFTERSLSLTLTSGKNYDVFLYNNSGTLTLELSAAWTNDTTRADALTTQDGIYVKSGATTRRWLGTIRASGSNTTEDSRAKRFVWNFYNRQTRAMSAIDTTDSWTYASATYRQANANAANQLDFVVGDAAYVQAIASSVGTTSQGAYSGIGFESTSVNSANIYTDATNGGTYEDSVARFANTVSAGRHYIVWLERCYSTGTTVFMGDNGSDILQTGIIGSIDA